MAATTGVMMVLVVAVVLPLPVVVMVKRRHYVFRVAKKRIKQAR